MKLHAESHVDHGLSKTQIDFLLATFADRTAFFIESVVLPPNLSTAPCDLVGPLNGDPPVPEDKVTYHVRGTRAWKSRLIAADAQPRSRLVTVIAGPHKEPCPQCTTSAWNILHRADCPTCGGTGELAHACILYTAYGGPLAPQEPDDPGCKDVEASRAFWREHALITLPMQKLG